MGAVESSSTTPTSGQGFQDCLQRFRTTFTDAELRCTCGVSLMCHKAVLAAYSPVFHNMFTSGMMESGGVVEVPFPSDQMQRLLNYMYTLRFDEEATVLVSMYELGCFYDIPTLKEVCIQKLGVHMSLDNIMLFFKCPHLKERAMAFIEGHFTELLRHENFKALTVEDIQFFADKVDEDFEEEQLLNAVLWWLESQEEENTLEVEDEKRLLSIVRFGLLPATTLSRLKHQRNIVRQPELADNLFDAFDLHLNGTIPDNHTQCEQRGGVRVTFDGQFPLPDGVDVDIDPDCGLPSVRFPIERDLVVDYKAYPTAFTMLCWAKLDRQANDHARLCGNFRNDLGDDGRRPHPFFWGVFLTDGRLRFYENSLKSDFTMSNPITSFERKWTHYGIVCGAKSITFYVNGEPYGHHHINLAGLQPAHVTGVCVGASLDGRSRTLSGSIHEMTFWRKALTRVDVVREFRRKQRALGLSSE